MEHNLKYLAELKAKGLTIEQLPKDAQIGIKTLNALIKVVEINENKGLKPRQETLDKIAAQDKWVYYEILDLVEEKDENAEEAPVTEEDVTKIIATEAKEMEDTKLGNDVLGSR